MSTDQILAVEGYLTGRRGDAERQAWSRLERGERPRGLTAAGIADLAVREAVILEASLMYREDPDRFEATRDELRAYRRSDGGPPGPHDLLAWTVVRLRRREDARIPAVDSLAERLLDIWSYAGLPQIGVPVGARFAATREGEPERLAMRAVQLWPLLPEKWERRDDLLEEARTRGIPSKVADAWLKRWREAGLVERKTRSFPRRDGGSDRVVYYRLAPQEDRQRLVLGDPEVRRCASCGGRIPSGQEFIGRERDWSYARHVACPTREHTSEPRSKRWRAV
jgi:hypothetical protein